MSGKTGGVSALAAADATRVKANRNPDFNKVLESRKNADIIEYLNSNGDEEQKKRDFQVSFSSVKLKSSLDEDISHPQHHPLACICVFPHILSVLISFPAPDSLSTSIFPAQSQQVNQTSFVFLKCL